MSADSCDPRIFREGTAVAMVDAPKPVIEALVQRAANETGCAVDWSYLGGRAVVKALGNPDDLDKLRKWFESNTPRVRVLP